VATGQPIEPPDRVCHNDPTQSRDPATPGALFLAHFGGAAGAVAILSAMENADAALVMADRPTQRVEPSARKSLRQIPSSSASPSLILGTGLVCSCPGKLNFNSLFGALLPKLSSRETSLFPRQQGQTWVLT